MAPGMPQPRDRGSLRWVRFAYLPKLLSCPSSAGPALVLAHVCVPGHVPVPVPVLVLLIIVWGPHTGIVQIHTVIQTHTVILICMQHASVCLPASLSACLSWCFVCV